MQTNADIFITAEIKQNLGANFKWRQQKYIILPLVFLNEKMYICT